VLDERGYDIVGSLDELRPDHVEDTGVSEPSPDDSTRSSSDPSTGPFADPDRPDEAAVADAATDAIVVLLQEVARLHESERVLRQEVANAYAELEASRGAWLRTKQRLVRAADDNPVAAAGLAVYRRVRGSSSRSA
jgi:hypothetical protein